MIQKNILVVIFISFLLFITVPLSSASGDEISTTEMDTSYKLTVEPLNGTVTIEYNNESHDIDYKRSFTIDEGTEVKLSANLLNTADWEVNEEMYEEDEKEITLMMDEDKDVVVESKRSTRESVIVFYTLFGSLIVISIIARVYIYFSTGRT